MKSSGGPNVLSEYGDEMALMKMIELLIRPTVFRSNLNIKCSYFQKLFMKKKVEEVFDICNHIESKTTKSACMSTP